MIAGCPLCISGDDFFGVSFFWHWGGVFFVLAACVVCVLCACGCVEWSGKWCVWSGLVWVVGGGLLLLCCGVV